MPTSSPKEQPSALLLIDIPNDDFPGGAMPLAEPEAAGRNAAALLARFRAAGRPAFHIRHEAARPGATFFLPATPGADIHPCVAPLPGETVILKGWTNSFRDADLDPALAACGAKRLAVAGRMTRLCVDATVRAAFDLGYAVTLADDACARGIWLSPAGPWRRPMFMRPSWPPWARSAPRSWPRRRLSSRVASAKSACGVSRTTPSHPFSGGPTRDSAKSGAIA